jgi:glycolate oxidase iron-sulfur subunit
MSATLEPRPQADSPAASPAPADRPGARIDYELFLDCVHCGLCTAACPTYVELGTEMDSPRGRIYLMRGVVDGRIPLDRDVRRHLDLCLDCRACESACPSGVQYGRLLEPFRADLQRLAPPPERPLPRWQRFLLFRVFPYARRVRAALWPARVMQRLGLDWLLERAGLVRLLPRRLRQMHAMLPRLQRRRALPEVLPAIGPRRARVALFTGCVADALFPQVNWATARVLQANGCEVWTPRGQACCGALHYHAGFDEPAAAFARANVERFREQPVDAIVTNVAGCGAMLKDYGHLLGHGENAEAGQAFAGKVRDVSEFLVELGPVAPTHRLDLRATYHDACHLCHAQQIRKQPRQLLEMIPGLQLVPLAESEICCGAAGSYNLTEPEMAERLGERKAAHILATKPQAVFTANAGCLLQIARHLKTKDPTIRVAHPVEALWAGYSGEWDGRG